MFQEGFPALPIMPIVAEYVWLECLPALSAMPLVEPR